MVRVTFRGEPYPVDDVEFARFLLLNARGELVTVADAQPISDGMWEVMINPEQTTDLEIGSTRLEVVVVSRLVSIPSFEKFSFVTVGP